jgi:hypothetical protein
MDELQMIPHLYFMKKMHWDMVYHVATSLTNTMKNSLLCLANVLLKFPSAGFHLLPIVHTVATIYKFAKGYNMLSL